MTVAERKEKGLTLARKQHQCQACYEPIVPGELYVTMECYPWHGDNDGFSTVRVCRFCNSQDACWYEDGYLRYVNDQEMLSNCRDQWATRVGRFFDLWIDFEYKTHDYDPSILSRLAVSLVSSAKDGCVMYAPWCTQVRLLADADGRFTWYKAGENGWREPVALPYLDCFGSVETAIEGFKARHPRSPVMDKAPKPHPIFDRDEPKKTEEAWL